MTSLVAQAVTRRYGAVTVVDEASLVLEPGRITALLGGSGAGKSTLLRLLAGLEPVDAGAIRFGEETLSAPGQTVPTERRRIGLVFQDFALFPHLTALGNVCFGLTGRAKADQQAIAAEWLARLGLTGRADAYPHQLSGGEQQRVSIARALAPEPVAILMDEPFSGLDPALREIVRDTALATIREAGIPALLVTHDAREAMIAADQLAVMRTARIVQTGSPESVYTAPVDLETAAALGPINALAGRLDNGTYATPFGSVPAKTDRPGACIAVREEALRLDPSSTFRANVASVARIGPLVRVVLTSGEATAAALVAPDDRPSVGDEVGVAIDAKAAFIFDADTTGQDRT